MDKHALVVKIINNLKLILIIIITNTVDIIKKYQYSIKNCFITVLMPQIIWLFIENISLFLIC